MKLRTGETAGNVPRTVLPVALPQPGAPSPKPHLRTALHGQRSRAAIPIYLYMTMLIRAFQRFRPLSQETVHRPASKLGTVNNRIKHALGVGIPTRGTRQEGIGPPAWRGGQPRNAVRKKADKCRRYERTILLAATFPNQKLDERPSKLGIMWNLRDQSHQMIRLESLPSRTRLQISEQFGSSQKTQTTRLSRRGHLRRESVMRVASSKCPHQVTVQRHGSASDPDETGSAGKPRS